MTASNVSDSVIPKNDMNRYLLAYVCIAPMSCIGFPVFPAIEIGLLISMLCSGSSEFITAIDAVSSVKLKKVTSP